MLAFHTIAVMKIECCISKIPCCHTGSRSMVTCHSVKSDRQAGLRFDKPSTPPLSDFSVAAPVVNKLSSSAVFLSCFNSILNIAIATHIHYCSTSFVLLSCAKVQVDN